MARLVKRKKRKISFVGKSMIVFFVSIFIYLVSSIFLNSYNIGLRIEIQKREKEIQFLKQENKKIESEISTLKSKEHIYEQASINGLTMNSENIISITKE